MNKYLENNVKLFSFSFVGVSEFFSSFFFLKKMYIWIWNVGRILQSIVNWKILSSPFTMGCICGYVYKKKIYFKDFFWKFSSFIFPAGIRKVIWLMLHNESMVLLSHNKIRITIFIFLWKDVRLNLKIEKRFLFSSISNKMYWHLSILKGIHMIIWEGKF